ncbi:MAG: hypothetical protein N0A00_05185 [Candidatus Bathyarchaeota archaeon]|nr:hypothetical protein [Candidatus Bathyarchaeota archaeon]
MVSRIMEGDILKVTLVEKPEQEKAVDLQHLETIAARILEVDQLLEECKIKLSNAQMELEEFRQKSEVERRFCELTGLPFNDRSKDLEEKVNSLRKQIESLTLERANAYKEMLKGLANIIIPVQGDSPSQVSEDEIFFAFRNNGQYSAITNFIRRELKFGLPPVYVTIQPEGIKIVGVNDKTSAVRELVKTIESLRARAKKELESLKPEGINIPPPKEEAQPSPQNKTALPSLKKFGKH